jgi:hypothetical protein
MLNEYLTQASCGDVPPPPIMRAMSLSEPRYSDRRMGLSKTWHGIETQGIRLLKNGIILQKNGMVSLKNSMGLLINGIGLLKKAWVAKNGMGLQTMA